jgi:large subunit ribosomal protein L17
MRHLKKGRKLGRTASHRKATLNNLARALVQYELIQTTDAKAKEMRRVTDKLITLGKQDTLAARRRAFAILRDRDLVAKVFEDLAKRDEIADRPGGYTRIIKLGNRRGDAAPLSRVSWVGATVQSTEKLRYPAHILERFDEVEVDDEQGAEEGDES